jgi:UDP-N-acetylmuramate--alanine ligase
MSDMVGCFRKFVGDKLAVINADEKYAHQISNCTTVTFGINARANYQAKKIKKQGDGYAFNLIAYSMDLGRIKLKIGGYHNIYNALAVIATADVLGLSFDLIKKAIETFNGVKRRNEFLGDIKGVKYFADYAHHPKEIQATLNAFREKKEKFITVFQPHTYSRTQNLMEDFIEVLKHSEPIIIFKTYPAREKYVAKGSALTLYKNLKKMGVKECFYAKNNKELSALIDQNDKGKSGVLALGAGDIYDRFLKIIKRRQKNLKIL